MPIEHPFHGILSKRPNKYMWTVVAVVCLVSMVFWLRLNMFVDRESSSSIPTTITPTTTQTNSSNPATKPPKANGGGTSGKLFTGAPIRPSILSSILAQQSPNHPHPPAAAATITCRAPLIGVTTTIKTAATRCIMEFAELFPVVVVGDEANPTMSSSSESSNIIFLSVADQQRLYPELHSLLPTRSFARKNMGFVHASRVLGACQVWDFDDDNCPLDPTRAMLKRVQSSQTMPASRFSLLSLDRSLIINPYLLYGSSQFIWPRGFPLENISLHQWPTIIPQQPYQVDVLQVLQHYNPDVDADWRLQYGHLALPMYWESSKVAIDANFAIHPSCWVPFNSQSTLLSHRMLPLTYLPHSVHGRVSDIWRSYFMQYFMRHFKSTDGPGVVTFGGQFVMHERNPHNYLADRQAELQMAEQVATLVGKFLETRPLSSDNLLTELPLLYDDLYTRGYVEAADVETIVVWMQMFPLSLTSKMELQNTHIESPTVAMHSHKFEVSSAVVQVNGMRRDVVPIWNSVHGHQFRKVAFYVPGKEVSDKPISGIPVRSISTDSAGTLAYESMLHAIEHDNSADDARGFLFLHDDTVWHQESAEKVATKESFCTSTEAKPLHNSADNNWVDIFGRLWRRNSTANITWMSGQSEVFYVAGQDVDRFIEVAQPMRDSRVPSEVAVPTIFHSWLTQHQSVDVFTVKPKGDEAAAAAGEHGPEDEETTASMFCKDTSSMFGLPVALSSLDGLLGHLC